MNSSERREEILRMLKKASQPVSATAIAREFKVSRQLIVGDIALLRASGEDIAATPRGYVLQNTAEQKTVRTIACRHDDAQILEELYTIVDNGGAVLDVTVEHAVYGQISAGLHVFSRYDADEFLNKLNTFNAPPLSQLTGGIHLHTITCNDEESFVRVENALRDKGFLLEKD